MQVDKISGVWKRWWDPHISCKFLNFIRPVCMMTTPYDWNDQPDNEWEMRIRLKQFYNLLWYSFYHSYGIEVHLRAQKKHEVTQTFFKVAYEYFLQQNLPPKQYNNSVVHLYPHPYYNIAEFQGGQTSGHLLQILVYFEPDAMLQLRTISHLMDQGCKEHLYYTQIMF